VKQVAPDLTRSRIDTLLAFGAQRLVRDDGCSK